MLRKFELFTATDQSVFDSKLSNMEPTPCVLGSVKKQNSEFLSKKMKVLILILLITAAIAVGVYIYVRPEPTTHHYGNWFERSWGNVTIKAGDGTLVCIMEKKMHKILFLRREVEFKYPDVSRYYSTSN